jgi:hypothetical protein
MAMALSCLLAIAACACQGRFVTRYASFAEVDRADAGLRGWIPSFVPRTARNITEAHDLDTNVLCGRFTLTPTEVQKLRPSLRAFGQAPAPPPAWCREIPEWTRFQRALTEVGVAHGSSTQETRSAKSHFALGLIGQDDKPIVVGIDEPTGHVYFLGAGR